MRRTSVVIADRHPVTLQGLALVLGEGGFSVVACCSNGISCLEAIRDLKPDMAVLDVSMAGLTGLEILGIVEAECLSTRLVFFTESFLKQELSAAVGSHAIVPKDVGPDILLRAVRQVADDYRAPSHCDNKVVTLERCNIADSLLAGLTVRERQIMRLVSEGLSNKAIGQRLDLTDGTVKVHLHNIYQKLDIDNRTLLATLAISHAVTAGLSVAKAKSCDAMVATMEAQAVADEPAAFILRS